MHRKFFAKFTENFCYFFSKVLENKKSPCDDESRGLSGIRQVSVQIWQSTDLQKTCWLLFLWKKAVFCHDTKQKEYRQLDDKPYDVRDVEPCHAEFGLELLEDTIDPSIHQVCYDAGGDGDNAGKAEQTHEWSAVALVKWMCLCSRGGNWLVHELSGCVDVGVKFSTPSLFNAPASIQNSKIGVCEDLNG